MKSVSILVPASELVDGCTVFKVAGTTPLTFRKDVKLYQDGQQAKPIYPPENCGFLVSSNAGINIISLSLIVRLNLDVDDALCFLEGMKNNQ